MEHASAIVKSWYKLADDLTELLEETHSCDVIIKVGEENDFEIFKAHSLILRARSEYFRAALSTTWSRKNSNGFYIIKLYNMNISYDIFGEVLFYIYGGYVFAPGLEVTEKLQLMIAADVLMLDHLINFLEEDLICNEKDYVNRYTSEVLLTVVQILGCKELLEICEKKLLCRPRNLFYSKEFLSIPRYYLIGFLERNILGLNEITIWDRVLNWGIHNTPECKSLNTKNILDWTMEQVDALKANINEFLPLIRFFKMDPKRFIEKVGPYKQIFEEDLYDEIIKYHEKFIEFEPTYEVLSLRLNSVILNESCLKPIASWIDLPEDNRSSWYDKYVKTNTKINYEEIPYDFHILYRRRGSKLTETEWCKYVYNQGPTLTVIKVKDDDYRCSVTIFGGYKSISWSEENQENRVGGDGFVFSSYTMSEYINLRWIEKHLALNMHLGSGNHSHDFRLGKEIYVKSSAYTIDTIEVFKVIKKEVL
ncbi:hypothetical protein RclHR1_12930006 [Rhizophagus clarus]|uniref:BTB domain-containing protein n=1 Tax=Rhizophagus clarus TaxID=94130 RepID=A0A2Z6QL62_9GLOM|nr:hypothetical protein RclHR1_12930006 [Rhizophagus clarus]GES91388.1 hypothetical protein GLOIN_2v1842911 [Rhizophagus clarus]